VPCGGQEPATTGALEFGECCALRRCELVAAALDLTRIRAERDDLRSQAQLLARIVQVLEIENHQLKEANTNLRGQVAAQGAVRDLTRRRRT
jgi:hypothetical protein